MMVLIFLKLKILIYIIVSSFRFHRKCNGLLKSALQNDKKNEKQIEFFAFQ